MNAQRIIKVLSIPKLGKTEEWVIYGIAKPEFAQAFASKLGPDGHLHVVDKSSAKLAKINIEAENMAEISLHHKDFSAAKLFDGLDGIFLAYSMHSIQNPIKFLGQAMLSTKANGKLLILDFDTRRANPWIKYPLGFSRLEYLAKKLALPKPKLLAKTNSHFGRKSYLAEITIPDLRL